MAKEEIQFVPGLFAKAPRETAPPFVKASISIKVADLGVFLRERHKAGEEWVNIDIWIQIFRSEGVRKGCSHDRLTSSLRLH
jgi:hypothetical protein